MQENWQHQESSRENLAEEVREAFDRGQPQQGNQALRQEDRAFREENRAFREENREGGRHVEQERDFEEGFEKGRDQEEGRCPEETCVEEEVAGFEKGFEKESSGKIS
jgi:hypothetical protein